MAFRYLKDDYPVFELANEFMDQTLARAFHSNDDRESALAEFKDRCSRRYHNFYPPVAKGEPVPPIGSTPPPTRPEPAQTPLAPAPESPVDPWAVGKAKPKLEPKPVLETKPTLPERVSE